MAGKVKESEESVGEVKSFLVDLDCSEGNIATLYTHTNRKISSPDETSRDRAHSRIFKRSIAKEFATEIASKLEDRFAVLWLPVAANGNR